MAQLDSKGFPLRVFPISINPVSCLYELLQLKQARYMRMCENGDMANFVILIQCKGVAMPVSFVRGSIFERPTTVTILEHMNFIQINARGNKYTCCDKAARAISLAEKVTQIGRYAAWQHAVKHGITREYRIARQLRAQNIG